ncbi:hypothetical protein SAMN05192575_103282 [Nocardioides alpinus]|uniref:Uncharacterized protein n=1 Tax=Nocardioides alpinus TaxID=748909 RepID=A0A1I0Y7V9_9ACTN|nr:DUF6153 family protein [Nocardioides alpinus]PKH39025.1 hypothetical protein CXG46_14975 [Nocardioides alpinus]SFB08866.1 hypothetical protein SAMN05192575_103282 [Nocardioides alpinus]
MIRTLWAAAALLAIVAMHGLAAHAGSADPRPLAAAATSHVGHAAMAADDSPVAAGETPAHGEHGHEMAVLGLCAAVLATSAILLLVGLGRPRSGILGLAPRAVTTTSHPVGVRTEHAPPDLHALSVLRC